MKKVAKKFIAMACQCEIVLATGDESKGLAIMDQAIAEVGRIEQKYSRYRPESVVGQINRQAGSGHWYTCDDETLSLLDLANTLYRQSDGLFDISSGILRQAWHFDQAALPSPEQLARLQDLIGWEKIERAGNRIQLPMPGMEIDFGGFGKEYAVDRAVTILAEAGLRHGFVNLGGDIRAMGPQADGQPWIVGI